jgi:hypothetical protein
MMIKQKLKLWFGLVFSALASGYFGLCVIFYAWLEASEQWSTQKAAIWVSGSALLTILFIYTFFRCLSGLLNVANKKHAYEQQQVDMRPRS